MDDDKLTGIQAEARLKRSRIDELDETTSARRAKLGDMSDDGAGKSEEDAKSNPSHQLEGTEKTTVAAEGKSTNVVVKSADETDAARKAMILEEDLQFESGFVSFPEKLMSLLEGGEVEQSMWWLPEGDAFCIVPANFEAILDQHFQGTKFESFTRKLNRWGFKRVAGQKVPPNAIAYYHHGFRRGQPEQLKDMSGSKARFQSSPDHRSKQQVRPTAKSSKDGPGAQDATTSDPETGARYRGIPSQVQTDRAAGSNPESDINFHMQHQAMLSHSTDLEYLAQQREAAINAELRMRLLRGGGYATGQSSDPTGNYLLGNMGPNRDVGSGGHLSGSLFPSVAPSNHLADQMRARDLTARLMLSQADPGSIGYPTTDMRSRLHQQEQQLQQQSFPQQSQEILNLGRIASTNRAGINAPDHFLDRQQRTTETASRDHPWLHSGGSQSQGVSDSIQTEQLLQLYLLQQRQREQQQKEQRGRDGPP